MGSFNLPKLSWIYPVVKGDLDRGEEMLVQLSPPALYFEFEDTFDPGTIYAPLSGEVESIVLVGGEGSRTPSYEVTIATTIGGSGDRILNILSPVTDLLVNLKDKKKVARGDIIGTGVSIPGDWDLEWRVFYNNAADPDKGFEVSPIEFANKEMGGIEFFDEVSFNPREEEPFVPQGPPMPVRVPVPTNKKGAVVVLIAIGAFFAFRKKSKKGPE